MWVFRQCKLMCDKTAIHHLYVCSLFCQSVELRAGTGLKYESKNSWLKKKSNVLWVLSSKGSLD